jgi:antitoxin VapB
MGLNLKNPEVERLAAEVARMAGETKTEAIRRALLERRCRLARDGARPDRRRALAEFLEREVWPTVPRAERGLPRDAEREARILGYGPEGV